MDISKIAAPHSPKSRIICRAESLVKRGVNPPRVVFSESGYGTNMLAGELSAECHIEIIEERK